MEKIYSTLQEFFKSIGLPLEQNTELTVHRLEGLHGEGPLQSPSFRTLYYTIVLIRSGKSTYTIDGHRFDLKPFSFYFTHPGHLKSFSIEIPLTGYMLTFSEKFVKQHFTGDFFQLFPFLIHETVPVMFLDEVTFSSLENISEQMLTEYAGKSAFKNQVLIHLLSVLLFRIKELLFSHPNALPSTTRGINVANAFRQLLNKNFQELLSGKIQKVLSVKEFADQLHLHPNYLSSLVTEETGKSASDWIQDRTLAEAQNLLLHSGKTVSEIAFLLGFTDTSHFGKFFKKYTGSSPKAFRSVKVL